MLTLPANTKIFISTVPLDMRKSFDGMAVLVKENFKKDVFSGHLFVFCNKRGDKIKVLYWDHNGFACWYKRLERGVFRMPRVKKKVFTLKPGEFSLLLEGIELTHSQRNLSL